MMKIALLDFFLWLYEQYLLYCKKKKIEQYRNVLGEKVRMACHPDITTACFFSWFFFSLSLLVVLLWVFLFVCLFVFAPSPHQ